MSGPREEAATIPGLALAAARLWPERDAVVDGGARTDFAALAERMMAAAAGFVAAGLAPGERVAIWAENGLDWIVACLGAQAAGGVVVPLNTRFREAEVEDIVRRAGVVMAAASREFLGYRHAERLERLDIPTLRRVLPLDAVGWRDFLAPVDAAARDEAARRVAALGQDDLSDIMFTSGTTGAPRGAKATHGQTVATARLWARATTIGPADRFLILWPFFHCSGYKAGWVVNLAVGAASHPEPTLDVSRLLARVERERITFLPGPPTLFQALLDDPATDPARLASLRVSITGAASVAPTLVDAMRRDLGIPIVLTGYGLTETCGTATMSCPDDPPETVATSCGRALPGIDITVVDETGRPVKVDATGEILIRGMNVMRGYLDDPAATREAVDADGWLRTGDIGSLDADGYLRITDRKKDMFITGGFNCYPAEIEKLLLTHPDIARAAVIGVPEARMGEVGHAFIVMRPGALWDAMALSAWARDRMANFKVPRRFQRVDALPVNATGKAQKFRLFDMIDRDPPESGPSSRARR